MGTSGKILAKEIRYNFPGRSKKNESQITQNELGMFERNPNLFPRRGGLRLPELTLREGDEDEESDLERDRERERDLEGLEPERERDLELERDDEPDTEGERRARLGFAMGDIEKIATDKRNLGFKTLADKKMERTVIFIFFASFFFRGLWILQLKK